MTAMEGEVVEGTFRRRERNAARSLDVLPPDVETRVAEIRPLDGAAQAVRVTAMLAHSRAGLLAAIAAHDLPEIREFKQRASAIQEIAKQVRMGKEFQIDAAELVRRAERGLDTAIRDAQERGEVSRLGDFSVPKPDYIAVRNGIEVSVRGAVPDANSTSKPSPSDFFKHNTEWNQAHAMGAISDEAFERVLEEARQEENLSRTNVARKAKAAREAEKEQPANVLQDQMEPAPAPASAPPPKKTARARKTVEQISITLSNYVLGLAEIDPGEVDRDELQKEINIIFESLGAIRKFMKEVNKQ